MNEVDGIEVEEEDETVDETVTARVATITELSDATTRDGTVSGEVDGTGAKMED